MGKKPKPFITEIQAEGTKDEQRLTREETRKEAEKLAIKMPTLGPDRLMYVRELLTKAFNDQLDHEVFQEFIRITNSYYELVNSMARAKLLSSRGDIK